MRILVVKTSSLGDIVHTLPAVTDVMRHRPDVQIDWVVEEAFTDVPAMHDGVSRVIPTAIRRWRKSLLETYQSGEFGAFRRELAATEYDLIVDAQGLIKSAAVARLARGPIIGLDRQTVRESLASMFYGRQVHIPRNLHAVERTRRLFGAALDYQYDHQHLSYGLHQRLPAGELSRDVLLFHGTTWSSKQWPEIYWQGLVKLLQGQGLRPVLLWGNDVERARAERIGQGDAGVEVSPRLSLVEIIERLRRAAGVVAVDTGLGHLAAALEVPMVSLFSASNPALTRPYGGSPDVLVSDHLPCVPCGKRTCLYPPTGQSSKIHPPCFEHISPEVVWQALCGKIKHAQTL